MYRSEILLITLYLLIVKLIGWICALFVLVLKMKIK
jgi:hypothetical protein